MSERNSTGAVVDQGRIPVGIVILGMVVGCIAAGTAVPYVLESVGGMVWLWEPQRAHLLFRTLRRAACFSVMASAMACFFVNALRTKGNQLSYWSLYGMIKVGCATLVAMALGSIAGAVAFSVFPSCCEPIDALWGWRVVQITDLGVVLLALPVLLQVFEVMQRKSMTVHAWLPKVALLTVPLVVLGCAFACREVVWAWSIRIAASQ